MILIPQEAVEEILRLREIEEAAVTAEPALRERFIQISPGSHQYTATVTVMVPETAVLQTTVYPVTAHRVIPYPATEADLSMVIRSEIPAMAAEQVVVLHQSR